MITSWRKSLNLSNSQYTGETCKLHGHKMFIGEETHVNVLDIAVEII